MKKFIPALYFFALGIFAIGCGNPQSSYVGTYGSINRTAEQGEAQCNAFNISNVFQGSAQHPTINGNVDQNDLMLRVTSSAAGFSSLQFYLAQYSAGVGGTAQLLQNGTALTVSVGNTAANAYAGGVTQIITPTTLQAAGINGVFYIYISGTPTPWQIIDVAINGNTSQPGQFLIPFFDADPLQYQMDHPQTPNLVQLHPFYNQINSSEDFVSMAQNFCFL